MSLAGKVVIVTGAARGLGREYALALGRRGAHVAACDLADCTATAEQVKSEGGDVRVVYSPLDAVALARQNPGREVVFFAIGFETTAPANAMAVHQAKRLGLENFSLLVSHVLVPPAIETILNAPQCRVQAFLAAGHVCSVMGLWQYPPLAERYRALEGLTHKKPERSRRDVVDEHLSIARAVAAGDARLATALLERHYMRTVDILLQNRHILSARGD